MTTIAFPKNTGDIIDDMRDAVGRDVTFYLDYPITCSACSLDPINNASTNYACPVCHGEYYIHTYSGIPLPAHITWGHSEQQGWVSGGQLVDGDCRIQVKYTVSNIHTISNSDFVDVDGKKMRINKRILRGVPETNRILLDLIELEETT